MRIVRTFDNNHVDVIEPAREVFIGESIEDSSLDLANLGTGYLIQNTVEGSGYSEEITGDLRVNMDFYDQSKWSGINPKSIYEDLKTGLSLKSNSLNKLNLKEELCLDRDAAQVIILKANKVQDKLVSL